HAYFEEWKFKHPRPEDMRMVFERESGKDLSWIFDRMLSTDEKIDIKALKLRPGQNEAGGQPSYLSYEGRSMKNILFPVTGYHGTDSLGTVWMRSNGTGKREEEVLPWPNADRVRIDAGNRTLDIDRRNNEVRAHGLF